MHLIINNLTQPQTVGEQTLPAGGQIVVESVDKRTRGLAERGFISINRVEETVFETPKEAEAKPNVTNGTSGTSGNQVKQEKK